MKRPHLPVAFVVSRAAPLPGDDASNLHGPPVDVVDDGTGWRLVFEVPGAVASRISVQIEGRVVTLRGEQPPTDVRSGQFLRIERVAGSFERSLELPELPDPERTHATFTDGILTIEIPRLHRNAGRIIPVKSGGPARKA
jgi:HSP20 family protein